MIIYERFFADWGPFNLGQIYHYIQIIQGKLSDPNLKKKKIIHYCDLDHHHYTNSAFLCMCFQYLILHKSIEDIYSPFFDLPNLSPFRDASFASSTFPLFVIDCLEAIEKASLCKIFDYDSFDVEEYERHERIKTGDMKWIVPRKILAFSGPFNIRRQLLDGSFSWCPEDYAKYFKTVNITDVVRLNEPMYDRNKFLRFGIRHHELQYPDGGLPNDKIIMEFLNIVDSSKGGVAIHCKAGLGRTGSLIGCYLMKKYHFTARQAIAWMRICRPGCVLGIQQQWLESVQQKMWNSSFTKKTLFIKTETPINKVRTNRQFENTPPPRLSKKSSSTSKCRPVSQTPILARTIQPTPVRKSLNIKPLSKTPSKTPPQRAVSAYSKARTIALKPSPLKQQSIKTSC